MILQIYTCIKPRFMLKSFMVIIMNLQISRTNDGIKSYPHHKHSFWEIMLYTEGEGYLYTPTENIPFKVGTIVIVPPEIVHGSVSEKPFRNISVGGNFGNSFFFDRPISLEDNTACDCEALAMLLYKNRMSNEHLLKSLSNTYISFILMQAELERPINYVINEIVNIIAANANSSEFNVADLLKTYNYSVDYIRQQFKLKIGMQPIKFLTKCRIEKACFLIEIYGGSIPLSEIAESCGYTDYVYFSKQFKQHTKLSPSEYLKKRIG